MKHDDVLGFTDYRTELFQIRFALQVTKDENERAQLKERLKEVRKKLAKLLYEDKLAKTEKMKGR